MRALVPLLLCILLPGASLRAESEADRFGKVAARTFGIRGGWDASELLEDAGNGGRPYQVIPTVEQLADLDETDFRFFREEATDRLAHTRQTLRDLSRRYVELLHQGDLTLIEEEFLETWILDTAAGISRARIELSRARRAERIRLGQGL